MYILYASKQGYGFLMWIEGWVMPKWMEQKRGLKRQFHEIWGFFNGYT
jgi:hypothetical protein